jgi:RNA recognition motif-containing protein
MKIYAGNLSQQATEEKVREAFESFGEVSSATIVKDKYTGQSRGFGFVEMPDQAQAQAAIKSLNGKEFFGQSLNVSEARPRADRGGPGGRGGQGGRSSYGDRNRY